MGAASRSKSSASRKEPTRRAARGSFLEAAERSARGKALRAKVVDEPDIRPGSSAELAAQIQKSGAKVLFEDMSNFNERADYYKRFSPMTRGM